MNMPDRGVWNRIRLVGVRRDIDCPGRDPGILFFSSMDEVAIDKTTSVEYTSWEPRARGAIVA